MRQRENEPISVGALVEVVGDLEMFQGDRYRIAPAFVRFDNPYDIDDDPFLSNQVHVPLGSLALVVSQRRIKDDDWAMSVLFDGLLLESFYTYTPFTMREVFRVIAEIDQCIG